MRSEYVFRTSLFAPSASTPFLSLPNCPLVGIRTAAAFFGILRPIACARIFLWVCRRMLGPFRGHHPVVLSAPRDSPLYGRQLVIDGGPGQPAFYASTGSLCARRTIAGGRSRQHRGQRTTAMNDGRQGSIARPCARLQRPLQLLRCEC
jgi:hypothetical protein